METRPPTDEPRRTTVRRARGGAVVPLALLVGAALVGGAVFLAARAPQTPLPTAAPSERYPNVWPLPPPADVAALLGGLGPGTSLPEGWRVRGVSPVIDQRIVIDVEQGERGFRVALVLKERDPRRPPRSTARYALYTQQPRPSAEALDDAAYAVVLEAIAARVREREARVPIPEGM